MVDVPELSLWTLRIKKILNCGSYPVTWFWKQNQVFYHHWMIFVNRLDKWGLFKIFYFCHMAGNSYFLSSFFFFNIFYRLLFIWCSICGATCDASQSREQKGVWTNLHYSSSTLIRNFDQFFFLGASGNIWFLQS